MDTREMIEGYYNPHSEFHNTPVCVFAGKE